MNNPKLISTVLFCTLLILGCSLFDRITTPPSPVPPTPAASIQEGTPIVHLHVREQTSFKDSATLEVGDTVVFIVRAEPVIYSTKLDSDGRVLGTSQESWRDHNLTEMQLCLAWDEPCQLGEAWSPFVEQQEYEYMVDWMGARTLWVRARFRDATGDIVPTLSGSHPEIQPVAQISYQLVGIWNQATPVDALSPPVQTGVAATITTYPLQGSVEWEGGGCCVGGVAGETVQAQVDFSAESPFGEVVEMRVAVSGVCFSEDQLADVDWEPFVRSKTYTLPVGLNWIGHYASVQYRDNQGNLSPVYCDDISVEGSPPGSTSTP